MIKYVLSFSARAISDLAEIEVYVSAYAPARAQTYAFELWERIQSLKQMPNRCPVAPESEKGKYEIRQLIHGKYRVLFIVKGSQLKVLRIVHGARTNIKIGRA